MKKTIKKIYRIGLIAAAGLLTYSCSEWLDFDPVAAENSASFYITMTDAEQAVTIAYSDLSARTIWDRNVVLSMSDVASDDAEAGGDYENEVPGTEEFNRIAPLSTNGIISETYGDLFRGIHHCNLALENIPGIPETDPSADPAIINLRIAELKFLRALNYMYLTHLWGQVPLVDHILAPSEYFRDKASMRELFDLIEKDLTEAIPVLTEKSELSSANIGRATKGAAKALLARMYLYESSYARNYPGDERFAGLNERWQDALDMCQDVIGSGEYSLVGADGTTFNTWHGPQTNGYRYLFTVEGENCAESIFEIQYLNDGLDYTWTRAGSLVQWVSPRYFSDPTTGTATSTGYWGLGWPTQELVDEYETDDVRFKTNIAAPGDSVEIAGGSVYAINFENTGTGYYMNKYVLSAEQFSDASGHGWHKSPFNMKLLRYADVILMAAEASVMLNDFAGARDYINQVRTRARVCGGGTVPADLTGNATLDDVIKERRLELAFEGLRFFDMVRWGIADDKLNGYTTPGGFTLDYASPRNDFWPLPQREITASNGSLTQNEGW
jgi:starch-binding outer membrane protein, SusD/RagB family